MNWDEGWETYKKSSQAPKVRKLWIFSEDGPVPAEGTTTSSSVTTPCTTSAYCTDIFLLGRLLIRPILVRRSRRQSASNRTSEQN